MTGIVSDTAGVSRLLHSHGALAFWDFAAAAPYVGISMNPHLSSDADPSTAKDAIFISPHKFVGGPGTPGVLVVKRKLLRNRVPSVPGGGTVSYVSERGHTYISDPSHREEGGTPAIIESIRAGLVFQLKKLVGCENIEALEKELGASVLREGGELLLQEPNRNAFRYWRGSSPRERAVPPEELRRILSRKLMLD